MEFRSFIHSLVHFDIDAAECFTLHAAITQIQQNRKILQNDSPHLHKEVSAFSPGSETQPGRMSPEFESLFLVCLSLGGVSGVSFYGCLWKRYEWRIFLKKSFHSFHRVLAIGRILCVRFSFFFFPCLCHWAMETGSFHGTAFQWLGKQCTTHLLWVLTLGVPTYPATLSCLACDRLRRDQGALPKVKLQGFLCKEAIMET